MTIEKIKPSLDEMWKFIDNMIYPNELVPDKTSLTYEQVFAIYSKLSDIDEMFKEIAQIEILKKAVEEERNNNLTV
ncbi:MAG: hypothetical protein P4K92_00690 [Candidatus Nitrosotalea sp.]|nr:hypothetical protein [Candidatus Nitrosotalea sp.]